MVFNSQFYHDLFNPQFDPPTGGPEGLAKVNKAIFNALKPGGLYVIIDHAGAPGTGYSQMNTLHRIEESVVKDELKQAGFVLEAESDVLRSNPPTRTPPWCSTPRSGGRPISSCCGSASPSRA